MALTDGFQALGQDVNKTSGQESKDKEGLSKALFIGKRGKLESAR